MSDTQQESTSTPNPMGKATAVIYLRSPSQRNPQCHNHFERQLKHCEDYADTLGVEIEAVYSDRGRSGLDEQRPGLKRLLHELPRRRPGYVIAADPGRLARSVLLMQSVERQVRRIGATLITSNKD